MSGQAERALQTAGLIEIRAPALVARYALALKHLTGRETALSAFHIDIRGYSPEIAEALGDADYLGAAPDRRFILLSTDQRQAPLLDLGSSQMQGVLRQLIDANQPLLLALSAGGAVVGEMHAPDLAPSCRADLLVSRPILIWAEVIGAPMPDVKALASLVTRFQTEPDGWRNEALIGQMIALAGEGQGGQPTAVELPTAPVNFWTAACGGVYVFQTGMSQTGMLRTGPGPMMLCTTEDDETPAMGPMLSLGARSAVAQWLSQAGLVESLVAARGIDAAAQLRQKMDFILVAEAERLDLAGPGGDRLSLRHSARGLGACLPEAYHGLAAVLQWSEAGGSWPEISSDHPAYFYLLRARPGPDQALVAMLLAELAPLDLRQLFLAHRAFFQRSFAGWSTRKREWVAQILGQEYQIDRAGARAALFGPEPAMDASQCGLHAWDAVARSEA